MRTTSPRKPVVCLRGADGSVCTSGAEWTGSLTALEETLLHRVPAPVLDVGCGPGRHTAALAAAGIPALGIDIASRAVSAARGRGVTVLRRSVFARLPGAGRWGGVLLLDGNLGIGGRPVPLLCRIAQLLRPDGRLLVEVAPPGTGPGCRTVCLEVDGQRGPWFRWTRVGIDRLGGLALPAGLVVLDRWSDGDRWYGTLRREAR